jgi:hypothetical protein
VEYKLAIEKLDRFVEQEDLKSKLEEMLKSNEAQPPEADIQIVTEA